MNPSAEPEPVGPAFEQLLEAISTHWPMERWRDYGVLVAVSGGADSVALLRALVHCKRKISGTGSLVVGHVDHRVRENSDEDAAWVMRLAETGRLECVIRRLGYPPETGAIDENDRRAECRAASTPVVQPRTDEASLRAERYRELLDIAREKGLRYIATAHHQDDQLETVLFRILRGTGLTGLQGIPRQRVVDDVTIVRPLLSVRRAVILDALKELNQPFRNDLTNASNRYTRNFLRNELIPLIESRFPDWDSSLGRLAHQAEAWTCAVTDQMRKLRHAAVARTADGWKLDIDSLKTVNAFELQFLLQLLWDETGWPRSDMGQDQWHRLLAAIRDEPPPAAFMLPGAVRVTRNDAWLELRRQT